MLQIEAAIQDFEYDIKLQMNHFQSTRIEGNTYILRIQIRSLKSRASTDEVGEVFLTLTYDLMPYIQHLK